MMTQEGKQEAENKTAPPTITNEKRASAVKTTKELTSGKERLGRG